MKEINIKRIVKTFNELTKEQQEEVIQKYLDYFLEDFNFYFKNEMEDFKEEFIKKFGFNLDFKKIDYELVFFKYFWNIDSVYIENVIYDLFGVDIEIDKNKINADVNFNIDFEKSIKNTKEIENFIYDVLNFINKFFKKMFKEYKLILSEENIKNEFKELGTLFFDDDLTIYEWNS